MNKTRRAAIAATAALLPAAAVGASLTAAPPSMPVVDAGVPTSQAHFADAFAGDAIVRLSASTPAFKGKVRNLTVVEKRKMAGKSWKRGCPVPLKSLVAVETSYLGFDNQRHQGTLVVARSEGKKVLQTFKRLYQVRFPVERMHPVERYGASDLRSMRANNTSGFNCRLMPSGRSFSEHAFGTAIDLNPLRNPYVKGTFVDPPEGRPYVRRSPVKKGMIVKGPVTRAFAQSGWEWGGDWRSLKDYQHFSKNGR